MQRNSCLMRDLIIRKTTDANYKDWYVCILWLLMDSHASINNTLTCDVMEKWPTFAGCFLHLQHVVTAIVMLECKGKVRLLSPLLMQWKVHLLSPLLMQGGVPLLCPLLMQWEVSSVKSSPNAMEGSSVKNSPNARGISLR